MTREEACEKFHFVASNELGIHESPGTNSTERIIEYDKHTTLKATSDKVAWCSAFVNFVVDTAEIQTGVGIIVGTHSAAAASWREWGVPLEVPIKGCIVVFHRNDPNNPNAAHVTFCNNLDISNGIISCLGGNQSDSVKVSRFPVAGAVYRSPF